MKIALILALPILAAIGCAAAPSPPPTPTPAPGATFHIPAQATLPTIAPTPSFPTPMPHSPQDTATPPKATPSPDAIFPDDEFSQDQSPADNPNETAIRPSPTPANQSNTVDPTATAAPAEPQIAPGKEPPPRSVTQFKRNPPIGALSSALSQLARDAEKQDADLGVLAASMPISDNESVAVTAYGAFGDDYPALRQSIINIGADIRNEDKASYIEMYIPVSALRKLANISEDIHRVDPIIPPSNH